MNDKPLLPYPEWNIDYSELTVGIRIGIGEHYFILSCRWLKFQYFEHVTYYFLT